MATIRVLNSWVKFLLKISNYFCGSLFSWGVNFCGRTPYFVFKDAIKYCAHVYILKLTFQWFLAPSMPPKRDVSTQNLPWLLGTDLRLNTETNKLESVVNMCRVITDMVTTITYLHVIKNFEGAEEDGDSVAETNFPGILTCNGLIFVGVEHTTKSTKISTP